MTLNIDVVSDFVCPWCFLGKIRLDKAVAEFARTHPETEIQVNWLPFFLNPGTPAAGEPYRPFLEAKFGGKRGADQMLAQVADAARPDGLIFDFDRIRTRPNTLKAHRLCYRAQSLGYLPTQVAALADALFRAHFQQGLDIGDAETLADIAVGCGDARDEVLEYLNAGHDAAAVKRMASKLGEQGVSGVPFYIINRKLGVSGAQSVATLGAALLQGMG